MRFRFRFRLGVIESWHLLIAGDPDVGQQYCGYVTSSVELGDYDCSEKGAHICETYGKYPSSRLIDHYQGMSSFLTKIVFSQF